MSEICERCKKECEIPFELVPSGDVLCQDCIWDFLKEGEELGGKK